jgi:aldehyde dehydrogenase (NAD+)
MVRRMATATTTASDKLHSYNPATGEVIGSVPMMTAAEVDAAVARARTAAQTWSTRSFAARHEELTAFRIAVAEASDDIAALLSR